MFRQIKSKRRVEHIGWIANDEKETSNYADMDTSQQGDKRRPGYRGIITRVTDILSIILRKFTSCMFTRKQVDMET